MKRFGPRFVGFLLVLALSLPHAVRAFGQEPLNEPQQVVQRVSDGVRRVLRDDRQLLEKDPADVRRLVDELFIPDVDFPRVCALVLGPFWEQASLEQRDAFGTELKTLLVNTYATAASELSEWEIRYLPLQLEPGDTEVLVRTQALYPGGDPISVDYRMHRTDGRWLAYDVAVAGVSLLANYRSSFMRVAKQKGIDGLIEDMAARNAMRRGGS